MIVEAPPETAHEEALGEQYTTLEQQHETVAFGMWVFLATELMLFGGLFCAYIIYRTVYSAGFAEGSRHLNLFFGGPNTAVLIVSSMTMAQAAHSARSGQRRKLFWYLLVTALIGVVFMAVKSAEYYEHFAEGTVPQIAWHYSGPYANSVQIFFLAYYAMTGLHAVHLTIAIGIVLVAAFMARRGAFLGERSGPIESIALYWHFIDMIWIFLLPLLYFIGLAP